MKGIATNKYDNNIINKLFFLLFAISMALGNWNPFVQVTSSEETATNIGTVITILFIPYLLFVTESNKWWKNKYSKPLFIFFFVIFGSSILNADTLDTGFFIYYAKLFAGILLCALLPGFLVKDSRLVNLSLLVYSLSCALIGTSILMGYGEEFMSLNNGRLWLFGENPNTTSGRYGMAVIMLLYIVFNNPLQLKTIRCFLLPFVFPLMALIVMSGSRGSLLITATCILLYTFLTFRKSTLKGITIFSIIIIPLAAYTISKMLDSDYSMLERLASSAKEEGGNEIRERLFWASYDIFLRNPIFGMGTADFKAVMTQTYGMEHTAHNLYIYIIATSGIVGFVPFALFLWRLFKGALRKVKETALPLLLLFFICFIAYKTGGILTYLFMWYIFSIIISSIETHIE